MLEDELSGLQITFLTDISRLVKFGRDVNKKSKSLVQDVEVLQKTVTDEKAFRDDVQKQLAKLKSSITASDALTAKMTELKDP